MSLLKLFDNSLVLPNKGPIDWQTRKKQPISEAGDLQIYGLAPLWLIYQTVSQTHFSETGGLSMGFRSAEQVPLALPT